MPMKKQQGLLLELDIGLRFTSVREVLRPEGLLTDWVPSVSASSYAP